MQKHIITFKYFTILLSISLNYSCATQSNTKANKVVKLCTTLACKNLTWIDKLKHCGTFIHECGIYTEASIKNRYSLQGFAFQYDPENSGSSTYKADREAFLDKDKPDTTHQLITPPTGISSNELVNLIRSNAKTYKAVAYWAYGPNSNSAADFPIHKSGARTKKIDGALGLHHYHKDSELDEFKNSVVKLFYEYARSKSQDLIKQIKSQTFNSGSFKSLNICDNKTTVIESLRELQAFYVSTQDNSTDEIIDLRTNNNSDYQNRLLASNHWNVTYDDKGETYWFLRLNFTEEQLTEISVKSSHLELP